MKLLAGNLHVTPQCVCASTDIHEDNLFLSIVFIDLDSVMYMYMQCLALTHIEKYKINIQIDLHVSN